MYELGYFGRLRPFHQLVQVVMMKVRCSSRTHRWLEKTSPNYTPTSSTPANQMFVPMSLCYSQTRSSVPVANELMKKKKKK